uniref:Uncharacterized protein n=1 Tax=Mycena chlorophos TaxID=658473 RepID=A0ABQ0LH51_MYCCL|nr:predicted protein [Mycena chlorophos]
MRHVNTRLGFDHHLLALGLPQPLPALLLRLRLLVPNLLPCQLLHVLQHPIQLPSRCLQYPNQNFRVVRRLLGADQSFLLDTTTKGKAKTPVGEIADAAEGSSKKNPNLKARFFTKGAAAYSVWIGT